MKAIKGISPHKYIKPGYPGIIINMLVAFTHLLIFPLLPNKTNYWADKLLFKYRKQNKLAVLNMFITIKR